MSQKNHDQDFSVNAEIIQAGIQVLAKYDPKFCSQECLVEEIYLEMAQMARKYYKMVEDLS